MTISDADTAELPAVAGGAEALLVTATLPADPFVTAPAGGSGPMILGPLAVPVPVTDPVEEPFEAPAPAMPRRTELRAERRQARRQQRRYALLGAAVLVGTLGATVAVLDVVH
jgi:hypothetical protein